MQWKMTLVGAVALAVGFILGGLTFPRLAPRESGNREEKTDQSEQSEVMTESSRTRFAVVSAEVERELRQLMASLGYYDRPVMEAVAELEQEGLLASITSESLESVWSVRQHVNEATEDEVLRALDAGLMILRSLQAAPREQNIVHQAGVPVYSDREGKNMRKDVKGLILKIVSPGGVFQTFQIYPTTRSEYLPGQRLSWEWSTKRVWDQTWYRAPDTGEIERAWDSAAEFVGRSLDSL